MTQNEAKKLIATAMSAFVQKSESFHVEQAGGHILGKPRRHRWAAVAAAVLAEKDKNART